jgi:CheY-like chemotaxis protein
MAALILALLESDTNANQVKACLEDCGHEVAVVNTFSDAIAVLSSEKIDLIISDVHLENGGSVFDFLRRVKKGQWTCEIPFVLFSSQPTPMAKSLADGVRMTARHLGAIKYLEMEVFDAAQFAEQINSLIPAARQSGGAGKETELAKKVGE